MFSLSVCEGKLQLGVHDGWEKEEAQIVRFDLCLLTFVICMFQFIKTRNFDQF